ncbi:MAG TPA: COX15/CtaA family protein [Acidimicrobiia bacterium]
MLGWNVLTILLGAVVRATGSGAGCGTHWPTCQGELVPALEGATAVEYTHRLASGVALLLVFALVIWVFRARQAGDPARRGAVLAAVAVVLEAAIGATLVLFEWVGADSSAARVVAVPMHLVNTLFLLASLTLTVFWLSGGGKLEWRNPGGWLVLGAGAIVVIFASGAVTALADTLFPHGSAGEGLSGDVTEQEHFLTRLRFSHPVLAVVGAVAGLMAVRRSDRTEQPAARLLVVLVAVQLGLGLLNISLGTPLWLQVLHLALADAIWITFVWLSARLLSMAPLPVVPSPTTG